MGGEVTLRYFGNFALPMQYRQWSTNTKQKIQYINTQTCTQQITTFKRHH